jgi:hypothetical protein
MTCQAPPANYERNGRGLPLCGSSGYANQSIGSPAPATHMHDRRVCGLAAAASSAETASGEVLPGGVKSGASSASNANTD